MASWEMLEMQFPPSLPSCSENPATGIAPGKPAPGNPGLRAQTVRASAHACTAADALCKAAMPRSGGALSAWGERGAIVHLRALRQQQRAAAHAQRLRVLVRHPHQRGPAARDRPLHAQRRLVVQRRRDLVGGGDGRLARGGLVEAHML